MRPMPDYYRILQVDADADADVVTAAYRALARRLHPDRDITGVEEYRMSELNRAYAVLRDAKKRRQYDAERALKQPMGPGDESDGGTVARVGGLAARWQAHERGAAAPSNGPGQPAQEQGETLLQFGRYAGMTLRQVAAQDAEYLRWLGRHSSGLRYRREIEQVLRESLSDSYSPPTSR